MIRHSHFARREGLSVLLAGMIACLCIVDPSNAFYSIGTNFSGTFFSQSGFINPDSMGSVGPNDVAVLINGQFSVYDRSGVQQVGKSLNQFWIDAGVNPSGPSALNPRIIYDHHSGRWFATSVDNEGTANNYLVGVSATSDPKGAWSGFAIKSDADNSHYADFPTMGLNQDTVVIGANMFDDPLGPIFNRSIGFLVIPKADLTQAVPTVANATRFQDVNPLSTGSSPQPVLDLDNGSLPTQILSDFNKPGGFLMSSSIGGTPDSPTLNTVTGFIRVQNRGAPPDIDQPGLKTDVDAGDNRFSGSVIKQHIPGRINPSLWAVHGVEINDRAAIEWYEIDTVTGDVLQNGTISDSSLGLSYPSIAVNDYGDAVIGFSGGDPNTFMSTYAAVAQTVGGVTTFDPFVQTKAGSADYERLDPLGRNRWGAHSATVVDPANERSFWTFQQFANATDSWQIQVTQIIVPEPESFSFLAVGGLFVSLFFFRVRQINL